MEFIEWLGLLALSASGCFFFVFLSWRAFFARKPRGAMSRGRIVWTLLGGLSILVYCGFMAWLAWRYGPPARVMNSNIDAFMFRAMFLASFAWGVGEIAIALRAAFARKRAQ